MGCDIAVSGSVIVILHANDVCYVGKLFAGFEGFLAWFHMRNPEFP